MARLQSLRDQPNTAREYETTYILRPNTTNEGDADNEEKDGDVGDWYPPELAASDEMSYWDNDEGTEA